MTEREELYPHQRRAVALLRAAEGKRAVGTESTVPESSRSIDSVAEIGAEASEAWGVLRAEVRSRQVLIEHFSGPPSPGQLAATLLKGSSLLERWHERADRALRAPLMLVLSVGRPRRTLAFYGLAESVHVPGIHRANLGSWELVLVDVRNLARVPGTSFLRLFDHRAEVAATNLRHLLDDRNLGTLTKRAVQEAIMSEPEVFDPLEARLTYEEVERLGLERGRKEGRKEGRDEGRKEGREEGLARGRLSEARGLVERLLLRRLGRAVSEPLVSAFARCEDTERLEEVGDLVVRDLEPDELERRALEVLRRT